MRIILFSFVILFLSSCEKKEAASTAKKYFSLDEWITAKSNEWKSANLLSRKTVYLNGSTDTITLSSSSVDWNNELQAFKRFDINQPAFSSSYEIISGQMGGEDVLMYKAADNDLTVQRFRIFHRFDPPRLRLEIEAKTKTLLHTTTIEFFMDSTGYTYREFTKPRWWGDDNTLIIERKNIQP